MKEDIDYALETIDEDYKKSLRIIGRYFDYLETCGLKEFNKFSKYKWTYDRDRSNGYSYVCIRYGSSLMKKVLIKKRAYIENDELFKWVKNKDLIKEALDEAYQYILNKISTVMSKIEAIKAVAEDYDEKLDEIFEEYDETALASKKLA